MRSKTARIALVLFALIVASTVASVAQSFPPALGDPIKTTQNISFDRSPTIVTDPSGVNPYLYKAYGSTASDDYLYVETSVDGLTWSGKPQAKVKKGFSPALTFYNGRAWIAYVSDGQNGLINGALYLTSVPNLNQSGITQVQLVTTIQGSPIYPTNSPTMAVYNGQIWINMIDSYGSVLTYATTDGYTFSWAAGACGGADPAGYYPKPDAAVGMTPFNNRMYYAYQTTNSNIVRLCYVGTDGIANYSTPPVYPAGSGISATVYGSYLTLAYKDNTGGNHVIIEGSTDGLNFTGQTYAFSMNGNNQINPSAAAYNNLLYVVLTANSSNHLMYTSHN